MFTGLGDVTDKIQLSFQPTNILALRPAVQNFAMRILIALPIYPPPLISLLIRQVLWQRFLVILTIVEFLTLDFSCRADFTLELI